MKIKAFTFVLCLSTCLMGYASLTPQGEKFLARYSSVKSSANYQKQLNASSSSNYQTNYANYSSKTKTYNQYPTSLFTFNYQNTTASLGGFGTVFYQKRNSYPSSFSVLFYPLITLRYKNLFEWDTMLYMYVMTNGDTKTQLFFSHLDWFALSPYLTFEGGKFLSVIGKFERELYYPWLNKMASYPVGFGYEGAAPQADIGIQVKGEFYPGKIFSKIKYAFFVANGPKAYESGNRIIAIDSEGFGTDQDGHKVYGGRVAFFPIADLEIGFSAATGQVGVFNAATDAMIQSSRSYNVIDTDITLTHQNFQLRGEAVQQFVGSRSNSSIPGNAKISALYAQGSYLFPAIHVEPVLRYGKFNSPNASQMQKQWAIDLNYYFAKEIVANLTYEFNFGKKGYMTNSNRVIAAMTLGMV